MPEKWIKDVKTNWETSEGFFKGSADSIAKGLKSASTDLKQAMSRLNFYINRAGDNLSKEDKDKLEAAKKKLDALYGKEEAFLNSDVSAKDYFKESAFEPTLPDMDEDFLKAYIDYSQSVTDMEWENKYIKDSDVAKFIQVQNKLGYDLEKKLVAKYGWRQTEFKRK